MTVSRVFASIDAPTDTGAAPVFPLLPFACMAYADHCQRDVAGYVDRLAHTDEAPLEASETLGLRMLTDMNHAFFALVWAPLGAAMSSADHRAAHPAP